MQDRSPTQDLLGNGFLDHWDGEDRYLHLVRNTQGVPACLALLFLESIGSSVFSYISEESSSIPPVCISHKLSSILEVQHQPLH